MAKKTKKIVEPTPIEADTTSVISSSSEDELEPEKDQSQQQQQQTKKKKQKKITGNSILKVDPSEISKISKIPTFSSVAHFSDSDMRRLLISGGATSIGRDAYGALANTIARKISKVVRTSVSLVQMDGQKVLSGLHLEEALQYCGAPFICLSQKKKKKTAKKREGTVPPSAAPAETPAVVIAQE